MSLRLPVLALNHRGFSESLARAKTELRAPCNLSFGGATCKVSIWLSLVMLYAFVITLWLLS